MCTLPKPPAGRALSEGKEAPRLHSQAGASPPRLSAARRESGSQCPCPSPLQPPKSDFNPVPGRKGASQEGDYRGMGETRRPPCSLAICTSWDPVSCEESAPCSDPSGPRHWALALEEFGKGTEGSFVNNLTHTLRPGSLCTVQGPVGLPVSRPLCPSFLFFF